MGEGWGKEAMGAGERQGDFFFFFFLVLRLELRAYTLSYSTSPFFVVGFFPDRVSQTLCLGWF
jgi:hypothetical protein